MKLDIPTRRRSCITCEAAFLPQSICFSTLYKEKGNYLRKDFCNSCWEQLQKEEKNSIFWKGMILAKPDDALKEIKKSREEKALELFKRTFQTEDLPKLFVLALYLARRRMLISRQETKEETLYEFWETGEMFAVPSVPLNHLQIDALQQAIAADLAHEHNT